MVNIVLHNGGKLSFACGDYMGGQVTHLGELDSDFISVTHLHKLLREDLGYNNFEGLWCKFEGEPFESGINSLDSDADVIRILKRLEKDKHDTLHVYVEHSLDLPDIISLDALQLLLCGEPSCEGEGGAQGRSEQEGDGQETENERGREGDGNCQEREVEVEGDREMEDEDSTGSEDECLGNISGTNDDGQETENERGREGDGNCQEREVEVEGDREMEDEDSNGSEDECLGNISGTNDDEPELFGDFVDVDGQVIAGEGEGGAQGRREQKSDGQERENERGREDDGNGQGREGEVEGDREGEKSDAEDDDSDGSENEDGEDEDSDSSENEDSEDEDSDSSEDEDGEDDDSDSSEDEDSEGDDSDGSEDEHLSNFSAGEVEGDRKREESDGEDNDNDGSKHEHLSNFYETDYDKLRLFGDFVSVDGEAIVDELSGLDGHVDEASDHMDNQNHNVGAPATACEDVHGDSSTKDEAHVDANNWFNYREVPVDKVLPPVVRDRSSRRKKTCRHTEDEPQNSCKITKQCYNVRFGTCDTVGHNAKSYSKPANPNQPINPTKSSNKKNKDTQGNDAKAGPSTRNNANAGTTKKKPCIKNKNVNRVLVLSNNARSCRVPVNINRPINPKKPSKKKNKDTQGNDAEAGPSTRNKGNAGITKKTPNKKNKNDNRVLFLSHIARSCREPINPNRPTNPKKPSNKKNKVTQGGHTEAGPSIGNKSEAGATKKMPGKGSKQKGASNDIGGNENKDEVCYVTVHKEQNFKQWLHENSLFVHQRKNLNPQFLQILRDVLRHIGYLHQVENKCHGNLSELNIVIFNGRGKTTGMLNNVSKKYVDDYLSLADIVRNCFLSQRQTIPTELELLLNYISTTEPKRLLNIEHHPIFLSPLQRLCYRVISYTFLYFGKKKKSFELKLNEKLPKYNWKLKVRTFRTVLNRGKSFKCLPEKQMKSLQYNKSATSFMRFGRNIVVHLADIDLGGKKLTAEEVDKELTGYWPEFMPILHQVLVDHGYLMFVHDAILK